MVTFRFYVVSTVAFFLALAVGVVVGSVLDGRIADSLQDRLGRVEASLDERVAIIDEKNDEIERLEQFAAAVAPFGVQNELTETTTIVVAETGLPDAVVQNLVLRLRESGSRVQAIIWLEPRWALQELEDESALAELVGGRSRSEAELRAAAWAQVLSEAGVEVDPDPDAATTTTAAPPTEAPDPEAGPGTTTPTTTTTVVDLPAASVLDGELLSELVDGGFLRLQPIDGGAAAPGGEVLFVAATGTESDLPQPGDAAIELVNRSTEAGVPSVLAEVAPPPAEGEQVERATIITRALEQGPVQFSTVDDLELLAGRVGVVLALADVRDGSVGRFGYGPDVDGVLPRWQGP